jgi:hypothetical protein
VTVLFDVKGSLDLAAQIDPDARRATALAGSRTGGSNVLLEGRVCGLERSVSELGRNSHANFRISAA